VLCPECDNPETDLVNTFSVCHVHVDESWSVRLLMNRCVLEKNVCPWFPIELAALYVCMHVAEYVGSMGSHTSSFYVLRLFCRCTEESSCVISCIQATFSLSLLHYSVNCFQLP